MARTSTLDQALAEYLESLPWYKRLPLKGALHIAASAGIECVLVMVVIIIAIMAMIWIFS